MKLYVITLFAILFSALSLEYLYSKTWSVNSGESISDTINLAEPGDTVLINKGVYNERFSINKSLSVIGSELPLIDGGGKGSVIKVTAPNTVIKGLKIRGSGSSLSVEDTGIDLDSFGG